MSLRLNLEYERLLPKMSDEEFTELKASIDREGQHYPIIVNENLEVLDGHHRFRACIDLGIEPDFEVRKFEDKMIEKKFVIEANLRRRHLNNFQLVELAVPLLEIEKALTKKRLLPGEDNGGNSQLRLSSNDMDPKFKERATEVVAKKAGVSTRTLERGKKILEKASEEDKQKLREGKTSITKVYREVTDANTQTGKNAAVEAHQTQDISPNLQNVSELVTFLERLLNQELFCPSCGNMMFECSKCHKTLNALLRNNRKNVE
jgi:hypothetical protein